MYYVHIDTHRVYISICRRRDRLWWCNSVRTHSFSIAIRIKTYKHTDIHIQRNIYTVNYNYSFTFHSIGKHFLFLYVRCEIAAMWMIVLNWISYFYHLFYMYTLYNTSKIERKKVKEKWTYLMHVNNSDTFTSHSKYSHKCDKQIENSVFIYVVVVVIVIVFSFMRFGLFSLTLFIYLFSINLHYVNTQ